jgi:hypothetical protein
MASSGWVADRFAAKFHQRQGHDHSESLGRWERAQAGSRRLGGPSHGQDAGAEAPKAHTWLGEQLRGQLSSNWGNKGMGGLLTSSGDSGTLVQRWGRREASGRRRWDFGCTGRTPVIVDRAN